MSKTKNMFQISDLIGADIEKQDRVEHDISFEDVILKEEVITDMLILITAQMITRKSNGYSVNEDVLKKMIEAIVCIKN